MSTPVMSSGGNAGLFDLAEKAVLDDNRLMPSDRTYPKSSNTISINEAIALMKKRKADPSLRIKGGLDDTSEAVRKDHKKHTQPQQATGKIDTGDSSAPDIGMEVQPKPAKAAAVKTHRGRTSNAELMGFVEALDNRLITLHKSVDLLQKSISSRNTSRNDDVAPVDVLKEFKASSHAVTFMLNGMEFTVKCLSMEKDTSAHTVVFIFPDDSEAFFMPPVQSELEVKYDGVKEDGKLYYFGMCFSLKKLGLKFLGFIYDNNSGQ